MKTKKTILILCTGNSCRSQMAEGIARHLYGAFYNIESAGTHPSYVHPLAIAVMKEIGIDISAHRSKSVLEFNEKPIDLVITVCGNAESCVRFPQGIKKVHWGFENPAGYFEDPERELEKFRQVRDKIDQKMKLEFSNLF